MQRPLPHSCSTDRRGFTVVELLIVVVLIGILAVIAIPKYNDVRERSVRGTLMSDLRNLATAQEEFFFKGNGYADAVDSLTFRGSSGVVITIVEATPGGWSATAARTGFVRTCALHHGTAAPAIAGAVANQVFCRD